jgi:hypothetical protein
LHARRIIKGRTFTYARVYKKKISRMKGQHIFLHTVISSLQMEEKNEHKHTHTHLKIKYSGKYTTLSITK